MTGEGEGEGEVGHEQHGEDNGDADLEDRDEGVEPLTNQVQASLPQPHA